MVAMVATSIDVAALIGQWLQMMLVVALVGGIIVLDMLAGALLAAARRDLSLAKLAQFLGTNLLPYAGGLTMLAVLSTVVPAFFPQIDAYSTGTFYTAAGLTALRFVTSIGEKLRGIGLVVSTKGPPAPPQI